jgi:hypothetical protein
MAGICLNGHSLVRTASKGTVFQHSFIAWGKWFRCTTRPANRVRAISESDSPPPRVHQRRFSCAGSDRIGAQSPTVVDTS